MAINTWTISGRLTANPEMRSTGSGMPVLNFTVAVDRPTKKDQQKQADFFKVTIFGKYGEALHPHMAKGQKVTASGRAFVNTWVDKNEQKRQETVMIAESIDFERAKNQNTEQAPSQEYKQAAAETQQAASDDEVPF